MPLLFGFDATHDSGGQPDHFDYSGSQKAQGPAFLGLGIQRSNMQVTLPLQGKAKTSRHTQVTMSGLHSIVGLQQHYRCFPEVCQDAVR